MNSRRAWVSSAHDYFLGNLFNSVILAR
jgi:hypothetical protein